MTDLQTKTAGKLRGSPFSKGPDPRRPARGPGRPPRPVCIPDILREIGAEVDPATKRTKLQDLMRDVWGYARQGQSWAVTFIADRTEGKVRDTLRLEGEAEPLELVTRVVRVKVEDAAPPNPS